MKNFGNCELSTHLGNVLNVVTDRKLAVSDLAVVPKVAYYTADVVQYSDYLPFGQVMPGRKGRSGEKHSYGFQGQLVDDELKGEDNSVNYKYRMHDPRLGRFFAVDPLANKYAYNSPYNFSENRVIDCIELEGLEKFEIHDRVVNDVPQKILTCADIYALFQVIDEQGKILNNFKYCSFEKEMKNYSLEGASMFKIGPSLNTPNKDSEQKKFGEVDSKGLVNNFEIKTRNFDEIEYKELEGGLAGQLIPENVLQVGTVPEHFDLIKVYLPTPELREDFKNQWNKKGYDKKENYNYKAKDIKFLEQPEVGNSKSSKDTIQVTFYSNKECGGTDTKSLEPKKE